MVAAFKCLLYSWYLVYIAKKYMRLIDKLDLSKSESKHPANCYFRAMKRIEVLIEKRHNETFNKD